MQTNQVHNRNQGKKKLAKLRAKRVGKTPKKGFKAKKPKGPSTKIIQMEKKIRPQGSSQGMELEFGFMKRLHR